MKILKLFIILSVLLLLAGCSIPIASPSAYSSSASSQEVSTAAPVPSLDGGSQPLFNPDDVDTNVYLEIQQTFLKNLYSGVTAGSPYIGDLLDVMVEEKALQHYSAMITDIHKTDDFTFSLTIEKIEKNPKFELGGMGTEPFLNIIGPSETVTVSSDVYIVLNTVVQVQMDEKLNEYIQPTDGHYFDFYTCGNDILFILEGMMP